MAHTTRLPKLRHRLTPDQAKRRAKKINHRAKRRLILSGVRRDKTARLRKFWTS